MVHQNMRIITALHLLIYFPLTFCTLQSRLIDELFRHPVQVNFYHSDSGRMRQGTSSNQQHQKKRRNVGWKWNRTTRSRQYNLGSICIRRSLWLKTNLQYNLRQCALG